MGDIERVLSATVGAAIFIGGLLRRSLPGLLVSAVGLALLDRGVRGHCSVYEKLDINTKKSRTPGVMGEKAIKVVQSITINRPRNEVYDFWRDLRNLPEFMQHLETVEVKNHVDSHWEASGPGGRTLEWNARIVEEKPNELIMWESLPGADLQSNGTVRFNPAPGDRGTEVRISMLYRPPFGKLGAMGAKLLNRSMEKQLEADLRRLKQLLETGEIATTNPS